jgi:ATP-binding cassette subfamily B protein
MRPRDDGRGRRFWTPEEVERTADPETRRANLRRIGRLFLPYRYRLGAVLTLILVSAGLAMISPFLVRDIFDEALPERDTELLNLLVGGLLALAIVTGALGVAQTWLSNVVGQRVMHDLRAAVYRHLQRLSLAFFTRTRTGEVQSRIANDIGGVQNVVTSTATSIVSNVTTVVAAVVAMFLLDWRLALFSLALLPLFVLLSRQRRPRAASDHDDPAADDGRHVVARRGVALGLRRPARQDDGARRRACRPLRA